MTEKTMPDEPELMQRLQAATRDLFYMSETDAPWDVVYWSGPGGPPEPRRLLELAGLDPKSAVANSTLEEFFEFLIQEQEWHGSEERESVRRYRGLLATMRASLARAQVFRVGRINLDIYIIGLTPQGAWAGIHTRAVET